MIDVGLSSRFRNRSKSLLIGVWSNNLFTGGAEGPSERTLILKPDHTGYWAVYNYAAVWYDFFRWEEKEGRLHFRGIYAGRSFAPNEMTPSQLNLSSVPYKLNWEINEDGQFIRSLHLDLSAFSLTNIYREFDVPYARRRRVFSFYDVFPKSEAF